MNHSNVEEKRVFAEILKSTFAAISPNSQEPSKELMKVWFDDLIDYPINVIEQAFSIYRKSGNNRLPTPGTIINIILSFDGRPSPEEAWGIIKPILGNEDSTTFLTLDMSEAWTTASNIYPEMIGARKAFLEVYSRTIELARMNKQPVQWFMTTGYGHNDSDKVAAIKKALEKKYITKEQAIGFLPASKKDALTEVDLLRENLLRNESGLPALEDMSTLNDSRSLYLRRMDSYKHFLLTGDISKLDFLPDNIKNEILAIEKRTEKNKAEQKEPVRPIRIIGLDQENLDAMKIRMQCKTPQPIGTLSIGLDGKPEKWIKDDPLFNRNNEGGEVININDIREN